MSIDTIPAVAPIAADVYAAFTAANAAVAEAEAGLRQAEQDAAAAKAALANPNATTQPRALMNAMRDAQAVADDWSVVMPTLRLRATAAQHALRRANGETHRARHNHGRALRLQAATMHDAALVQIENAKALHARGNGLIEAAHAAGMERPFDGSHLAAVRTSDG